MEIVNFSAGPSALYKEVLEEAREEFLSYQGRGYSIAEISHRSPIFEELLFETKARIKRLYKLDENFEILFLQGGASLQFAQIPMNLYKNKIEFIDTGVWTSRAMKEADILQANYEVIASSKDENYSYIPKVNFSDNIDYGYLCSNNTIYGTQYKSLPKSKAPLVIDASSDFFSRELDFSNIGLLFGGAQKNCGISGLTLLIIRKDLLQEKANIPSLLSYKKQAEANSMLNTPNTFGIYILSLTLKHLEKIGGLAKVHELNQEKAEILYKVLDASDFYQGYSCKEDRSLMNLCFKLADEKLQKTFLEEAEKENLLFLKGHKELGGIRASLYNSMEKKNVEKLADFMKVFEKNFS